MEKNRNLSDIFTLIAGMALIFYGVFQVYPPGAYTILGLLILNDLYIEIEKD